MTEKLATEVKIRNLTDDKVEKILKFVNENFSENITTKQLDNPEYKVITIMVF